MSKPTTNVFFFNFYCEIWKELKVIEDEFKLKDRSKSKQFESANHLNILNIL